MRRRAILAAMLVAVGMTGADCAQLEELFSEHVQIQNPVGEFAP